MFEEDWNTRVLCIFLYILIFLSYRYYQHCRRKNIYKKIRWIANKSTSKPGYNGCYGDGNLTFYIRNNTVAARKKEGIKINKLHIPIPEEYLIIFSDEEEQTYISHIIDAFRKYEIDCFFKHDKYSLASQEKFIYKMSCESYFMFSLMCYVRDCADFDSRIFKEEIYKEKNWFDKSYFSCQLTDCGRVYYKINLITSMYCENTFDTKPLILQPQTDNIMEYLQSNEVKFWHYRP